MGKLWLIIQREYLSRVKKKSFVIITLLAPLGMALMMVLPILLTDYGEDKQKILINDQANLFDGIIKDQKSYFFTFNNGNIDSLVNSYEENDYNGILFIPKIKDYDNATGIKFYSNSQISARNKSYLSRSIEKKIREKKIELAGYDKTILSNLDVDVRIQEELTNGDEVKSGSAILSTGIGYIMAFAIYIILMVYGTMVMKSVSEEKTSRIVEVMISSVKPFQLMLGKIIGVGLVGLTQFSIWMLMMPCVYFIIGLIFHENMAEMQQYAANPELAPNGAALEMAASIESFLQLDFTKLIGMFLFYFLGGYFMYASIFAAIGSAMGEETDNQSLSFIAMAPIIIAIMMMSSVIANPNSTMAVWGSIIPLFSPILMVARIPFDVPLWEIIVSMISLIIGIIAMTWFAARIYRVGILMYGKKVTMKELWKWLFYKA